MKRISVDGRFFWAAVFALSLIGLSGCASLVKSLAGPEPTVILVSLDGFRWDYTEKAPTPNLNFIAATGVRAESLIPVFPTKTFPNHYSVVTGLYPERHGIVANNMFDPDLNLRFSLSDRAAVEDGRWWGGEPIWVTLEKEGKKTATLFWPGSEAEIGGVRPSYWSRYDSDVSYADRIERALNWLDLPDGDRPVFIALYSALADSAGHDYGPDSPQTAQAVAQLDEWLGRLISGLRSRERLDEVNLIVTSDHGMAAVDPEKVILIEECIDVGRVRIVDWSPVASIWPPENRVEDVHWRLKNCHPNMRVFRKGDTPEAWHYRSHSRIAPVIAVADEGWTITTRARWEGIYRRISPGNHGYDNQLESMRGIFMARGPAFRKGLTVKPFLSIHAYPLMAKVLGFTPAPNDGSLKEVEAMLVD